MSDKSGLEAATEQLGAVLTTQEAATYLESAKFRGEALSGTAYCATLHL